MNRTQVVNDSIFKLKIEISDLAVTNQDHKQDLHGLAIQIGEMIQLIKVGLKSKQINEEGLRVIRQCEHFDSIFQYLSLVEILKLRLVCRVFVVKVHEHLPFKKQRIQVALQRQLKLDGEFNKIIAKSENCKQLHEMELRMAQLQYEAHQYQHFFRSLVKATKLDVSNIETLRKHLLVDSKLVNTQEGKNLYNELVSSLHPNLLVYEPTYKLFKEKCLEVAMRAAQNNQANQILQKKMPGLLKSMQNYCKIQRMMKKNGLFEAFCQEYQRREMVAQCEKEIDLINKIL